MATIIAVAQRSATSLLVTLTAPVWIPLAFVVGLIGLAVGAHRAD
jgi:hypothetical protein